MRTVLFVGCSKDWPSYLEGKKYQRWLKKKYPKPRRKFGEYNPQAKVNDDEDEAVGDKDEAVGEDDEVANDDNEISDDDDEISDDDDEISDDDKDDDDDDDADDAATNNAAESKSAKRRQGRRKSLKRNDNGTNKRPVRLATCAVVVFVFLL